MIAVKNRSVVINKVTYAPGMKIRATEASTYKGLYGCVIEVCGGGDKGTDNETADIACEFYPPDDEKGIEDLERIFTNLCGTRKDITDIALDYVIMSPEMIRPVKNCRIYQIPAGNELTFCQLSEMKRKGYNEIPRNIYEKVFDGDVGTENLDTIYMIFNINHPEAYTARSLSMSDVVELYDGSGSSFYYCDKFRFEKVRFKN